MSDKKRDDQVPGEEEEKRIGDEAEFDEFDDEELEPSAVTTTEPCNAFFEKR